MRQQTGSTHHAVLAVPTVVDGFADRGHQHATDAIAAARTKSGGRARRAPSAAGTVARTSATAAAGTAGSGR